MAAPDPFSAIVNTIAFARLLQTTITNSVEANDNERMLIDPIRLSALAPGGFVKMFGQVPGAGLSEDDEALIAEMCDRLPPAIQNMREICVKIHEEGSRWGRFRRRMAWVTYRNSILSVVLLEFRLWMPLEKEKSLRGLRSKTFGVSI